MEQKQIEKLHNALRLDKLLRDEPIFTFGRIKSNGEFPFMEGYEYWKEVGNRLAKYCSSQLGKETENIL